MRKDVGASAGLLALLALFIHTELPHSEDSSPAGRSGGAGIAAKNDSAAGDRIEAIEGPWLATQAFFHVASSSPPRDLLPSLTSAKRAPREAELCPLLGLPRTCAPRTDMFSVVATVADPSHTHMALYLDEQAEAIERSVQAGGWDFTEQWLPWADRFDGNEPDIKARRAQRRMQRDQEELPGVLVFRAQGDENGFPKRVLFVFLVPETVTGGINGPAFYAAMHLANVLSKRSDGHYNKIGLLAPSFSGGFASLSELVLKVKAWKPAPIISSAVYGNVVNLQYASGFVKETGLSFHGGTLDAKDYQGVLCAVEEKYHMDGPAAVLKEDEGGSQQSINPNSRSINPALQQQINPACRVQTYTFPREISHLRNAYQEASGDAVKNPYADQPGRVNFSIRDPNSGEDSIPTFSETQTPLVQDTILRSITDELNRQHTHVVFIEATNPLDALFLLRAVRAACPNTRVFIERPDVLFVAAAAREDLDGTLFLSAYPMFFEGDDWLECTRTDSDQTKGTCKDSRLPERLMFADSLLQGLYNVTQFLLTDLGAGDGREHLRGYRQPGHPYPGVWVLTLNRFGFVPVDLLPENMSSIPRKQGDEDWFKHYQEDKETALPRALIPETSPRPWMLTVLVVSIGIVLACVRFVRCNLSRQGAKPIWLVLSDGYTSRFEALLCACLSLSALEWILALPWCIPWSAFFVFDRSRLAVVRVSILGGFAAPLLTLLFTWCLLRRREAKRRLTLLRVFVRFGPPVQTWLLTRNLLRKRAVIGISTQTVLYYILPVLLFGFAVVDWFYLCNRPGTGLFFRFRALELYSGSSPALPLALACLVFFCIALFHLKQYALAGLARPRLKVEPGVPPAAYRVRFKSAYHSTEQRIAAPWTLERHDWVSRAAAAAFFAGFCFLILWESPSAFELRPYNVLLGGTLIAILLCLAAKWYDLLALWVSVNKLLDLIQVLPLRPAIQRIAEDWPRRPIWAFDRSVSKEAVEREMLYALHRRAFVLKKIEARSIWALDRSLSREYERLPEPVRAKGVAAGAGEPGGAADVQLDTGEQNVTNPGEAGIRTDGNGQARPAGSERPPTTAVEANRHLDEFRKPLFGEVTNSPEPRPEARSGLRVRIRRLALYYRYYWNVLKGTADPAAYAKLDAIESHEKLCADFAEEIYDRDLRPAWRASLNEETESAREVDHPESLHHKYADYCADFVALQFCRFVAYAVAQVKRMATSLSLSFVLLIVLFNSYSPEGSQLIARWLGVLFLVIGFAVWRVFSQMERNPILSAIAHTTPGELSGEFWLNLLVLGGLPLLGVLGRLFPSVSQFLFQWIAPSVQAVR